MTTTTTLNAEVLVRRARTALLLDAEFWGQLILRLETVPDPTCQTAWTDGTRIGYSPAYVASLSPNELRALLAHEVAHCAFGHPWRRDGRDPQRWNVACDKAINPVLRDAGFTLPPRVLFPDVDGKSAEWYYAREPADEPEPQPQDGDEGDGDDADGQDSTSQGDGQGDESDDADADESGADGQDGDGADDADAEEDGQGGGDGADEDDADGEGESGQGGDPSDGSDDARGASEEAGDAGSEGNGAGDPSEYGEVRDAPAGTEQDWRDAVSQAAAQARARGNLPASLAGFARQVVEPDVDWRSVFRRFVQEVSRADYSWKRPSPRYAARGLYMPSLMDQRMGPMLVVVDTSGSTIDPVTMGTFEAELNAIVQEAQPRRVFVMYCDAQVQRVDVFEDGETIEFDPVGGGGTDFRPAFDAIDDLDDAPSCVVYLTDLFGAFPDEPADVPTLWASTTRGKEAPWGETVHVDA